MIKLSVEKKETAIPQLEVKETPANCPVPPPCPVCPTKPKATQVFLKVLLVLTVALVLAFIILIGSGLRITRKESLLDIWLASRRPAPEVTQSPFIPSPTISQPSEPSSPVTVTYPSLTAPIKSPLTIKGTVESGWMFEGVFPVKLLDTNRKEISRATAKETTPGSWQSGKPVEFSATLTFTTASSSGFLVFEKDNPSGLPENAQSFEIPIKL